MSMDNFISYLQQLLSMTDSGDPYSVALAQTALNATIGLVRASLKADAITIRIMIAAQEEFQYLVTHRDDYAGVPGEYKANELKRRRLRMMLQPGC